jgi:hypothetical protein
MDKNDRDEWMKFRSQNTSLITAKEYEMVCLFHSKYFNHKFQKPCTCSPKIINSWISQINKLYDAN